MIPQDQLFELVRTKLKKNEPYTIADLAYLARQIHAHQKRTLETEFSVVSFAWPFINYLHQHQLQNRYTLIKITDQEEHHEAWLGSQWLDPSVQIQRSSSPIYHYFSALETPIQPIPTVTSCNQLHDFLGVYLLNELDRKVSIPLGLIAANLLNRHEGRRQYVWNTFGIQQCFGSYYGCFPRFAMYLHELIEAFDHGSQIDNQSEKVNIRSLLRDDGIFRLHDIAPFLTHSARQILRQLKPSISTRLELNLWFHVDAHVALVDLQGFRRQFPHYFRSSS